MHMVLLEINRYVKEGKKYRNASLRVWNVFNFVVGLIAAAAARIELHL